MCVSPPESETSEDEGIEIYNIEMTDYSDDNSEPDSESLSDLSEESGSYASDSLNINWIKKLWIFMYVIIDIYRFCLTRTF